MTKVCEWQRGRYIDPGDLAADRDEIPARLLAEVGDLLAGGCQDAVYVLDVGDGVAFDLGTCHVGDPTGVPRRAG